jgi:hypothetical protein
LKYILRLEAWLKGYGTCLLSTKSRIQDPELQNKQTRMSKTPSCCAAFSLLPGTVKYALLVLRVSNVLRPSAEVLFWETNTDKHKTVAAITNIY